MIITNNVILFKKKQSLITTYNSLQQWLYARVTYMPLFTSTSWPGYLESPQSLSWATLLKAQASAKRLRWIPFTTKVPTCMQISECKFEKGTGNREPAIWWDMMNWWDRMRYAEIMFFHIVHHHSFHTTSIKQVCLFSWELQKTPSQQIL